MRPERASNSKDINSILTEKKEFENKNHGKRLNQRRPAGFIRSNKKKN